MAYHIYHTRGIVLRSAPVGESNRFYKILTPELGLVTATAQSVREQKGKLRMVLQDFSRINVDLVRGRDVWRIISALEVYSSVPYTHDAGKLVLFARVAQLVCRLVQGEEKNQEIFDDLDGAATFLSETTLSPTLAAPFETLAVFRVLVRLGYIDTTGYERFLVSGEWTEALLTDFLEMHSRVLPLINRAMKESHL